MDTYYCAVLVVLHLAVVESLTPAVLSVQNVVEGTTASFECLFSAITSTSSLLIKKDGVTIYICGSLTFACSAFSADSDYSDVTFPGIGTTTGKGTFTVDNADQARDGGIWVCKYGSSLESAPVTFVVNDVVVPTQAVLSVQNVVEGETATFECSYSSITSSMEITKDNVLMYECVNIALTCSALSAEADYSDVTFTGIGTTSGKGTFTVDNADQARDGGSWVCKYGSSLVSDPAIFVVNETDNDTCACRYYWLFILVLIPCFGLVVVIIIVSRYKTLVISTMYVHVTKNIVKLKLKPEFEPVPNTTYATCAQNGLTENVEFIDGLLVVEFRHLIPERQHDVIIYCQNPADMKLYKSETFAVFTLKDSSNTNPKECSTVLALHSLDLTVSQRKVGLSWTSPIAFESTKVMYWFGSDKNITISANKPSQATSSAEMTRLPPGRMITFTITGETDGTKYPSGTLHQKTLKD